MSTKIIVSYDGTNNEDDAIALGRLLGGAGAELHLAYVQHVPSTGAGAGALGDRDAHELLARGVQLAGSDVETHIVTDRSTPAGLQALADRIGAQAIVFCSDSHTAPGHITVGNSAARLLENGSVAIAVAPAGLASRGSQARLGKIATIGSHNDPSVEETAASLARAVGASVTTVTDATADLLVLGSRPETEQGRVSLSASVQNLIDIATSAVLVLPRGTAIAFGSPAAVGV